MPTPFSKNSKQLNKLKSIFKHKEVSFKTNVVTILHNVSSGQIFRLKQKQKVQESLYIIKMSEIINARSKFRELESTKNKNGTIKLEEMICKLLKERLCNKETLQEMFELCKLVDSITPTLYDLPKLPKTDIILRPIVSMVGSP